MDAWLGADAAEREALAGQLVQEWQQEAEHLVAQRCYREATRVSMRIVAVDPGHVPALQGRAQAYRQVGMMQAAELDERTLQALLSPRRSKK